MSPALMTSSDKRLTGGDQARGLRALVARRRAEITAQPPRVRGCHTIVVAGGKGGVGRSVIALNLAITLAQRGDKVGLLDSSPDFGNIELLCGLNGYWNLSHVAQGSRQLDDVMTTGPAGVRIFSGASCLTDPNFDALPIPDRMYVQLVGFESSLDWLVVDASGGAAPSTREFANAADDVLIVTTPEATAIAEAYASVKTLSLSYRPRLGMLVNQADSELQARRILDRLQDTAHSLLHVDLHRRGSIPRDEAIPASVNARCPFVLQAPNSPATSALQTLVQRWTRPPAADGDKSYFSRLRKRESGCLRY